MDTEFTFEHLPWRGITREVMTRYSVVTKIDPSGKPVAICFPYGPEARKVRNFDKKEFYAQGKMSEATLFGKDCFSAAEAQAITITEGELDALSAYQMLGSKYPVVSIRSAVTARKDCAAEFDYLNSFQKIYLALDNDEPGRKAAQEIAGLFDFNKVYNVQLSKKDANEYLEAGEGEQFRKIWWNSRRYLPTGIKSTFEEFDEIIDKKREEASISYPFETLNGMTYGIRKGETTIIKGLEGLGKTEILRAVEYHILKNSDDNLGVLHCEEDEDRILKGFAGFELKLPAHLPDSTVSKDEIKAAYRRAIGRTERLHIHTPVGIDDPDIILDHMRFLATVCNCGYIMLDNIQKLVTGLEEEDERKKLDYLSSKITTMAKERHFAAFVISHVNDAGLTRGSRNIGKEANTIIHIDRNVKAGTMEERNKAYLVIEKNRFGSKTGPAGTLWFDPSTFMLTEMTPEPLDLPPAE